MTCYGKSIEENKKEMINFIRSHISRQMAAKVIPGSFQGCLIRIP